MKRCLILSSSRVYLDVQYRGNCFNCCLYLSSFYIHNVGFLQCRSCYNVAMLFFFSVDIIFFLGTFPSLHPTFTFGIYLVLLDLLLLLLSIPSLCTYLIFSIVLQSTHRVLLFQLVISIKDLCFQFFSDILYF